MKQLTPQTARTSEQLAQLRRDRLQTKHCTFLVDGKTVSFLQRALGPVMIVTVPKVELDRVVRFYLGE